MKPLGGHVLVTTFVANARVMVQAPPTTTLESTPASGLELPAEQTYFFDAADAQRSKGRIPPRALVSPRNNIS